ncbi:MAG: 4Fe-4S binding protein [Pseudomonadota bacterium]|nr:4Fe-4S binding protein [Pseudomonadota bacterium]
MKELVVMSGKGGTGKTTVTGAFAMLAENIMVADADVDAANLQFLLQPSMTSTESFSGGSLAVLDPEVCAGCGLCTRHCRFDAFVFEDDKPVVDETRCEGCGACVIVCPQNAIHLEPRLTGFWHEGAGRSGRAVYARLEPGAENSGKLVAKVRARALEIARETGADLLLTDGPPGLGCPAIAALAGADAVLVVAEPTPSGAQDALRLIGLAAHFGVPVQLCVNKWDLHPALADTLEADATAAGATICPRLRYDRAVTDALMQGRTAVETDAPIASDIRALWQSVRKTVM